MDYIVHGVTKGRTQLSDFHFSVFYTLVWAEMFKLVLEKTEEPEIKLPTIRWIIEKGRYFQKNIYFCFIDCVDHKIKPFDCVDHSKLENSERDRNTRPPDLPLEKSISRSGSNS